MLTFAYTVKDEKGETIKGIAQAVDRDSLIDQLQEQGYFVISTNTLVKTVQSEETRSSSQYQKKKFTHQGIATSDTLLFAKQLATMIEAGVNLLRSLNVILEQVESKKFYAVLSTVRDAVEQGASLSQALARHPKIFNTLWVSLIEVGEASGTMPMVLNKLSFYIEREEKFRSSIISSLIYPAILFLVSISAILVFAFVIGPQFESLYAQFDTDLPAMTIAVLGFFKFLTRNFIWILLIFCAIFFIGRKYCQTINGRLQFEKALFNLPVVGPVVKTIVVEKFTSQLAILVQSGVPILYALNIVERLIENKTCERVIKKMAERIREGQLISTEMEKSSFFPPMATQMIAIGEETGELGKMLNHVSEFYQRSTETFIQRFSTIFEPVMLVSMGVVIGVLVLAMFLPIFDIATISM